MQSDSPEGSPVIRAVLLAIFLIARAAVVAERRRPGRLPQSVEEGVV